MERSDLADVHSSALLEFLFQTLNFVAQLKNKSFGLELRSVNAFSARRSSLEFLSLGHLCPWTSCIQTCRFPTEKLLEVKLAVDPEVVVDHGVSLFDGLTQSLDFYLRNFDLLLELVVFNLGIQLSLVDVCGVDNV